MHLKEELAQRGFLKQYTDEKLFDIYEKGGNNFYFGVDPSADSMTIGNFVALMQAIHVMLKGNKCYLVVGGATGMIGNPSGKDAERNFLDTDTLAKNQQGIHNDFQRLCENIEKITGKSLDYEIVNNYDWFKDMSYLDFLREVGKIMTVNRMMNKDIVKSRISDPDKFISYAEFSYMLIMGYDFYYLNKKYGVDLEVGGSDERDGILAGIEITHKLSGNTVYGITNNLILDSNGKKFGKSEGNALRLNPQKNPPYVVYQYFMNATDEDIGRYLKLVTLMSLEEIQEILEQHSKDTSLRYGQQKLAYLVTHTIFGETAAQQAKLITQTLFSDTTPLDYILKMSDDEILALNGATGNTKITELPLRILEALVLSGLCESNSEAKKDISNGAIYLNEQKVTDIGYELSSSDFLNSKIILLRKGKKNFKTIIYDQSSL